MEYRVRDIDNDTWLDPSRCFLNPYGDVLMKGMFRLKMLTGVYEINEFTKCYDKDGEPVFAMDIVDIWSKTSDSDDMSVINRCVIVENGNSYFAVSIKTPEDNGENYWYDVEPIIAENCFEVISNAYDYESRDGEVESPELLTIRFDVEEGD